MLPLLPFALGACGLPDPGELPPVLAGTWDPHAAELFSPQYPLWTDGAEKRRWIALPDEPIDGSDPDAWDFPTGTRLWKEFAFAGTVVETRYMERLPDGDWRYATYVGDGPDAVLAPDGATVPVPGGVHDVPSAVECTFCHDGPSPVLGFSALQLSPDRDPGALHADEPGLDLDALIASGRLVGFPDVTPRIAADTALERAARGYLHGNCGGCHDAEGDLASLGMDLRWALGDAAGADAPAFATTAGRASRAPLPSDPGAPRVRVVPGDPDASVLLGRMRSRDPRHQMPPLGTRRADDAAIDLISAWITSTHKELP